MAEPLFKVVRVAVQPQGAFGVLLQGSLPFAVTLERTYPLAGSAQLVKIPAGLWHCTRTIFHRGGYPTYEIHVPSHTRLLFHKGNVEDDSEGCVLVGEAFSPIKSQPGVAASAAGFEEFMERAAAVPSFSLRVIEAPA